MTSFAPGSSPGEYSENSGLLSPEESLDDDELGTDPDEGYSPVERPWGLSAWGTTEREAASHEDLEHRLSREEPEQSDTVYSDGIGDTADTADTADTDGEPIDDQVGDVRAGRLIIGDIDIGNIDASDPSLDYWPHDVGIDGAGASAEEAAVYVVSDDDLNSPDDTPSRRRTITTGQGHPVETDAADNSADSSTDSLDDLAAFLMHHAYQPTVTDAERLQILAVVDAYQDGDEPSAVESAMRTIALRFGEHADYRPEWRPQPGSST